MNKSIYTDLTITLTNQCNFNCSHCLRGESEEKEISLNKIQDILCEIINDNNLYIRNITLSGGEPFLYFSKHPDFFSLYKKFLEKYKEKKGEVPITWIITNGSIWDNTSMQEILNINAKARYDEELVFEDYEFINIQISQDKYHNYQRSLSKNLEIDNKFKFFTFVNDRTSDFTSRNTLPLGNAIYNNLTNWSYENYEEELVTFEFEGDDESIILDIDIISITANGLILSTCDYSFENEQNILKTRKDMIWSENNSIYNIVTKNLNRSESYEC